MRPPPTPFLPSMGGPSRLQPLKLPSTPRALPPGIRIPRPTSTYSYTSSAGPSAPKKPRGRRWVRRTGVVLGVGVAVYAADKQFNASALTRSVRTAWIGLLCTLDYKINFQPSKADKIDGLHERVASRLKWAIDTNQGLYLKLGQALGLQAALLPKPYREAFGHVFDRAPSVPYEEVVGVFRRDLHLSPEEIFDTFTHEPMASASIAQVHQATLPAKDGSTPHKVAVKVQKPAIEKQMEWDLFSYRSLMWLMENLFDIPTYFVAKYVSDQMRLETSFLHEASNARRCAEFLAKTPELRDDVYVPRVYGKDEGCVESDRVMVMEWVDGCRLNDKAQLEAWKLDLREVMDLAIATMSAMTFSWGFVHCDPHPGNILVRPHPTKKGKPQVILIDHGLYIPLPEKFREEYCQLWRSLFVLDVPKIEEIAKGWGISLDANMFASAILLRPSQVVKQHSSEKSFPEMSQYEQQVEMKRRFKTMLENEAMIPREIIFLTRCQRMMQANNQVLGSPSARVNVTAKWAAKGLRELPSHQLTKAGLRPWLKDQFQSAVFRITLGLVDIAFFFTWLKQRFSPWSKGKGWEDMLQAQLQTMAQEEFGIDIDDKVFIG